MATAAGFRIMERGGNVGRRAMCFCSICWAADNGIGGEVPTLVYSAGKEGLAIAAWRNAAAYNRLVPSTDDLIPGDGYLPACVPAPVDTWATALARFGTLRFADVLQPAIEFAEHGFPIYEGLQEHLAANRERYLTRYPTTGALYLPAGGCQVERVWRNPSGPTSETAVR
jgi:gamma-glutamyltranspeptidase/glutathione hydrolase